MINDVDSIKKLIKKSTNSHETGELKYHLAKSFLPTSIDSSLYFTEKVIDYAVQTELKDLLAKSYFLKGYLLNLNEDFAESVKYYLAAKLIYQKLGNIEMRERLLDNVVLVANQNGAYQVSEHYSEERLLLAKEIDDYIIKADIFFDLGITYRNNKNFTKANKMFFKAKTIYEFEGSKSDYKTYAKILNAVGSTQFHLGILLGDHNYLDSALYFYEKSMQIDNSVLNLAKNLNNIGNAYLTMDSIDMSRNAFQRSLELKQLINSKRLALTTNNNLGRIHKR